MVFSCLEKTKWIGGCLSVYTGECYHGGKLFTPVVGRVGLGTPTTSVAMVLCLFIHVWLHVDYWLYH